METSKLSRDSIVHYVFISGNVINHRRLEASLVLSPFLSYRERVCPYLAITFQRARVILTAPSSMQLSATISTVLSFDLQ